MEQRGVWVTTQRGTELEENEVEPLRQAYVLKLRKERTSKKKAASQAGADADADVEVGVDETDDWREDYLPRS